jgi:hypothetical protein
MWSVTVRDEEGLEAGVEVGLNRAERQREPRGSHHPTEMASPWVS